MSVTWSHAQDVTKASQTKKQNQAEQQKQQATAELSLEDLNMIHEAFGAPEAGQTSNHSGHRHSLSTENENLNIQNQGSRSARQVQLGQASSGVRPALEISLITDVALAAYTEPVTNTVYQAMGAHDPRETGFNLQQVEMHLASNVDHRLRAEANIVFTQFGVEVEEAYLKTLSLPQGLQLRAGQMLTRFGRINPTHPHSWAFLDQVLVIGKLMGAEGNRGLGLELSWLAPLPWMFEVVTMVSDSRGACCVRSGLGANNRELREVSDFLYTTALKQFFDLSDDWGVLLGFSYQRSPNASGPQNLSELLGADLNLRFRPRNSSGFQSLVLQGEWIQRNRQYPNRLLKDAGGYMSLVYEWSLRWSAGLRAETMSGIQDDPLDPTWISDRHRQSLQMTFRPSHFSRLRLQINRDQYEATQSVYGLFLGLEGVIGAHGAHDY